MDTLIGSLQNQLIDRINYVYEITYTDNKQQMDLAWIAPLSDKEIAALTQETTKSIMYQEQQHQITDKSSCCIC